MKRLAEKGETFSHKKHAFLVRKAERINWLIDLLVNGELHKIADLPKSYEAAPKPGDILNTQTDDTASSATD